MRVSVCLAFFLESNGTVHETTKTQQNAHTHAFLGPTVLFTPLKVILLQCFQQ